MPDRTPQPITNKKLAELTAAERFLPHYNSFHQKRYRVDYHYLLNREENESPDVLLMDLDDPTSTGQIEVEVKKAPDTSGVEASEALWATFIGEVINVLKEPINQNQISVFVQFDHRKVQNRQERVNDINIITNQRDALLREGMLKNGKPVNGSIFGLHVIQEFSVDGDHAGFITSSPDERPHNDPPERIVEALNKNLVPDIDVLLITIDTQIGENRIDSVQKAVGDIDPRLAPKEVWVIETILGGGTFGFVVPSST